MSTVYHSRLSPKVFLLYALALLREFRGTIITLLLAEGIGGALIFLTPLENLNGARPDVGHSLLAAWMALIGQSTLGLGERWYILIIEAVYPLLGLAVVIEGVIRFGGLVVSRRRGEKEWMKVMASTYRDHVVLCGIGHLGFRVLQQLVANKIDVVAIERDPNCRFLAEAKNTGVPILIRDMKEDQALVEAGVAQARAIIIASNDDLANIEVALDARRMNPSIRVVMRLFDQQIAQKIASTFALDVAFSASALAAPVVAGFVSQTPVLASYKIGEVTHLTVELPIESESPLAGQNIKSIEDTYQLRILGFAQENAADSARLTQDRIISPGDRLVISGPASAISRLSKQIDR